MSEANNDIAIQFKLQRDMAWAEIDRLNNSRIQEIAASHQSNMESLLEVARERDAVTAELARVTKERDEVTAEAETTKAFYVDTDKQRRDGISELAALRERCAELAELREDKERLTKLLSDCFGILEIALRAHPGGAFLNAVCEEDLPRFRAAIDAAREGQKSAEDAQGGAR